MNPPPARWLGGALLPLVCCVGSSVLAAPFLLQNDQMTLELDPVNGAFTRVVDLRSGMTLSPPPGMAENFGLGLLFPDKTSVLILGREQTLSGSRRQGHTLSLVWDGPLKDMEGGPSGQPYEATPVFLRFLEGGAAEMFKDYATWERE